SDKIPPVVSCSGPQGTHGDAGWYTTEVAYTCSASDAQSGLANASDASFTLQTTGDGADSTPSRAVKDKAGNTTIAGPYGPFDIDLHDPTITTSSPADGAVYVLGSAASASYACTDTTQGSGIETCAGTTQDEGAIDTSSVGPHTFSVTATDRSGRTATET